jgi:hypothetical protein
MSVAMTVGGTAGNSPFVMTFGYIHDNCLSEFIESCIFYFSALDTLVWGRMLEAACLETKRLRRFTLKYFFSVS